MADIKLFSLLNGVNELPSTSVTLEKELQTVIEQNMNTFFGVTFLKSEFTITNGRIGDRKTVQFQLDDCNILYFMEDKTK